MQPQRKGPYLHDLNEGKGWKKAFLGTWSRVLKETQWDVTHQRTGSFGLEALGFPV